MEIAKEIGKRLLVYVIGGVIVCKVCEMLDARASERRKRMPKSEKTRMDWKGNIVLGTKDYQVV